MIDMFAGSGAEATRLSGTIQDAWTAFSRTADPSTPQLSPWSPFDGERGSTMVLDTTCALQGLPRLPEPPAGIQR